MKYRELDSDGDMQFGRAGTFLINSPAAVAQSISTRLQLKQGEWFLNTAEGLNRDRIVGYGTEGTRDQEVKERVLNGVGVREIVKYASSLNNITRKFAVQMTVETDYGQAAIAAEGL